MKKDRQKKPFKDTKFGQFLNKAKDSVPDLLNVAGKIATGNISGAVQEVGDMLKDKSKGDLDVKKLLNEFEMHRMEYEKDLYELEIADRDSARKREVDLAKVGRTDWLMYATGTTGLLTFIALVYSVLFREMPENAIVHQLIGMIEGVALTIFAYYFGTSKSSKDKDEKIRRG